MRGVLGAGARLDGVPACAGAATGAFAVLGAAAVVAGGLGEELETEPAGGKLQVCWPGGQRSKVW